MGDRDARDAGRPGGAPARGAPAAGHAGAIAVGGRRLTPDRSGALYWEAERTLIVADLHLEKAAALAGRGALLPPYDTRETLARLAGAVARYDPARIVALGDSFHRLDGPASMGEEERAALARLQRRREWVWIAGNHDPEIAACAGGRVCAELRLGGLVLRHEPAPGPAAGEIAGHLHPVAKLARAGATLRRPCFVGDGRRLVLPAFGAFTGGLNVRDAAFAALFGRAGEAMAVWVVGEEGLYPVAPEALRPD